jgi:hypothetical protein
VLGSPSGSALALFQVALGLAPGARVLENDSQNSEQVPVGLQPPAARTV